MHVLVSHYAMVFTKHAHIYMLVSHFTTLYPFHTSAFPRKQHKASADTEVMRQADIGAFIEFMRYELMRQADIGAFVDSAFYGTLTLEGITAAVASGIPVNGRNRWGETALHNAVIYRRRELVVALLAAGADANVKDGASCVWKGAFDSTADILQLLINGGGNVTEQDSGQTPLIAVVLWNKGDAAARLQVLLRCPELDLDTKYDGMTADEWAVRKGHSQLAAAIAEERLKRVRWSAMRCAWVAATART
jgi:ankyrin repeat protein